MRPRFANSSGSAALLAASESRQRIDLLLTDIMMPGMDGRELARRFKTECGDAPVIFMSGYSRLDLPQDSWCLRKPFTAQTLLHTVEETLGGNHTREGGSQLVRELGLAVPRGGSRGHCLGRLENAARRRWLERPPRAYSGGADEAESRAAGAGAGK